MREELDWEIIISRMHDEEKKEILRQFFRGEYVSKELMEKYAFEIVYITHRLGKDPSLRTILIDKTQELQKNRILRRYLQGRYVSKKNRLKCSDLFGSVRLFLDSKQKLLEEQKRKEDRVSEQTKKKIKPTSRTQPKKQYDKNDQKPTKKKYKPKEIPIPQKNPYKYIPDIDTDDSLDRILRDLMGGNKDIRGAWITSPEGLPIASSSSPDVDEPRVAAMTGALLSMGERVCNELDIGPLEQVIIRCSKGSVSVMEAGENAVLTTDIGPDGDIDSENSLLEFIEMPPKPTTPGNRRICLLCKHLTVTIPVGQTPARYYCNIHKKYVWGDYTCNRFSHRNY